MRKHTAASILTRLDFALKQINNTKIKNSLKTKIMKTKQKVVQKVALALFILALTFNIGVTTQNEERMDLATISLGTMTVQAQSEDGTSEDFISDFWNQIKELLSEELSAEISFESSSSSTTTTEYLVDQNGNYVRNADGNVIEKKKVVTETSEWDLSATVSGIFAAAADYFF